jgi:galactose mutarotase-like enzyme
VFGKLQIYDAWDYPYICIEPVTNANDGFNRAALNVASHSVVVLEPGRSLTGAITISAGAGAGNM